MPVPAVLNHYVRVTAALAATGASGTSSIFERDPVAQPLPTGPLVHITSADDASIGAATAAAALWNGYYAGGSPLPPATVSTHVVNTFDDATTVGLASGYRCPPDDPRHLCGPITLSVRRGWEPLFVDIFVHEIGHAVVYSNAQAAGRAVDSGHHWNPAEDSEIFGPRIAFSPWVAPYTITAAGGGAVCAHNGECSSGSCGGVAGFRRVPGICLARGRTAATSAGGGAGRAGGGVSTTAIAAAVAGGIVAVGLAVAIAVTVTSRGRDDATELLI